MGHLTDRVHDAGESKELLILGGKEMRRLFAASHNKRF